MAWKMDHLYKRHLKRRETGASHDKTLILPKNCVAFLVGNAPVTSGPQLVLVNNSHAPTILQEVNVKRNSSKPGPVSCVSPTTTNTTTTSTSICAAGTSSTFATTKHPVSSKSVTMREQLPVFRPSGMIKALAKQYVNESTDSTAVVNADDDSSPIVTSPTVLKSHTPLKAPFNKPKKFRSLLAKSQPVLTHISPSTTREDHQYNIPKSQDTSGIVPAGFALQKVSLPHHTTANTTVTVPKSFAVSAMSSKHILPAGSIVQVRSINPRRIITHVSDNETKKLVNHPQRFDYSKKTVQIDDKSPASVALAPVGGQMSMVIGSIASLQNQSQITSSSLPTILQKTPITATTYLKQVPSPAPTFPKKMPCSAATFLKEEPENTTAFVKPSPAFVVKRNKMTIPVSKHGRMLPFGALDSQTAIIPSVITMASSQPCPTLQTILAKPIFQTCSNSLLSSSNLKPGLIALNIPSNYISTATHQGDFQQDQKSSAATTSNLDYYTSLEKYEQSEPVMVMRPVLDSDDSNSNSTETLLLPTEENETKLHTGLDDEKKVKSVFHSLPCNDGEEVLSVKEDTKKAPEVSDQCQTDDSLMELKIQSVFSLADMPSSEVINFEEGRENTVDVNAEPVLEEDGEMDFDSEEEEEKTTYKINENTWKSICPPSYVVLERLYPQDIKKKHMGEKKASVHCSRHCRERTLWLLCDLNLMRCEHKANISENTINVETDQSDLSAQHTPLTPKVSDRTEQQSPLTTSKTEERTSNLPSATTPSDDKEKIEKQSDEIVIEPPGHTSSDCKPSESEVNAKEESIVLSYEQEEELPLQEKAEIIYQDLIEDSSESEIKQPESTTKSQTISSSLMVQEELDQFERDIFELKKQVEEKRHELLIQKMQRQLSTSKLKPDTKDKSSEKALFPVSTDPSKFKSKQSLKNLPAMLRSLLKSNTTLASQRLEKKGMKEKTSTHPAQQKTAHAKFFPLASTSTTTTIPSFITNCPASSLFSNADGKKTSEKTDNNLLTTVPVVPSHHKASVPAPDKNNPYMGLHLGKVYAALQSLAKHFKSMGHTPNGTQFVMLKNAGSNSPVVLKIEPDALLPHNLEALRKSAETSLSNSNSTTSGKFMAHVKPLSRKVNETSSLSSASPPSSTPVHKSTVQSVRPTNRIQSTASPAHQEETASNSQTSLSRQNPVLVRKMNSPTTQKSPRAPKIVVSKEKNNASTSRSMISLLPFNMNRSSVNPSSSQSSLHSLLTTNSTSTQSPLTHVPLTSSLLPERKKRSTDHLSAEERAAKRKKFEEKYPLPPGVIIKCEPDSSEYELDSNWSVTSEIQTGYVTSTETTDFDTACNDTSRTGDASNSFGRTSRENDNRNSQRTMLIETDTGNDHDIVDDNTDSPPPLDSVQLLNSSVEKDHETSQMDTDETPPVLQPMASLSVNTPSLMEVEDEEEPGHKSVTASLQKPAQIYDSGYDSVGPSSSSESLGVQHPQKGPPPLTQKSKIERLKEILKQKQQQVESIMKKRSTMPEVDLNAL